MKIIEVVQKLNSEIHYDNWRLPNHSELKLEWDIKQKKPAYIKSFQQQYNCNVWDTFENFLKAVKQGHIERLPFNKYDDIDRVTRPSTFQELKNQSIGYAYPRFPERILQGFKDNDQIPMPIILDNDGSRVICAGNTRLGAASVAKITPFPKILVIPSHI
jgi:hypothetical protein